MGRGIPKCYDIKTSRPGRVSWLIEHSWDSKTTVLWSSKKELYGKKNKTFKQTYIIDVCSSQNGFAAPVAQPKPILRTKLQNVVKKCKNVMCFKLCFN